MQLEGRSAQSARDSVKGHLWKERGVEAPGTEQGSGSQRTEGQGETEAGGGRLLVAASVQASAPEASLLRLAWSSCWAPPCLLQGGYSGGPSDVPRAGLVWLVEGPAG